jgi:hypothetical protein
VPLTHSLADVPTFQQLLAYVPTCEGHMKKMIPRAKIKVPAPSPSPRLPSPRVAIAFTFTSPHDAIVITSS